jgi:hypothetical protein
MDRSLVEGNARELERMRGLIEQLDDAGLSRPVNDYWTVAGVLGHIAFWDGRALFLADKLRRGEPYTPSDDEPEDVDWINDASRPLIHAIPPTACARLALEVAQQTDESIATLSPDLVATLTPGCPLTPLRAAHRGTHLDEIEATIR